MAMAVPSLPQGSTASQNVISRDVPCIHCGYNLRGMQEGGNCPECGRAVANSLKERRLALSDPAWLRRVIRGFDFILIALALAGALFLALIALAQAFDFGGSWPIVVAWGAALPPGLLGAWGCWLVTAPEPGRKAWVAAALRRTTRWTTAALCVLVTLTGPSAVAAYHLVKDDLAGEPTPAWLVSIAVALPASLSIAGGLLGLVFAFSAMCYGYTLALRMRRWWFNAANVLLILGYVTLLVAAVVGVVLVAAGIGSVVGVSEFEAYLDDMGPFGILLALCLMILLLVILLGTVLWHALAVLMVLYTFAMTVWYRFALASELRIATAD